MKPKNNKIADAELSRLREIIKSQAAHIKATDAALKKFADERTVLLAMLKSAELYSNIKN